MKFVVSKLGRKQTFMAFALLALALVLAGCAGSAGANQSGGSLSASTPEAIATTAPAATMAPEPTIALEATAPMTSTAPITSTGATTSTTSGGASAAAPTGPATVMATANSKFGDILTDDKGMTLYLFTKDTPNTSNCYNSCEQKWPPLLTSGAPTAGKGAEGSLMGTTTRKDGTTQVTYNGWPLYYWYQDKAAGDTNGQDVGGVWYVVSPKGEKVETPAS